MTTSSAQGVPARTAPEAHILIVEDDEDIQQLVSYNLIKNGFQASCASSGEEGLELVRQRTPALILLDLMLPGIDGLEVCRRLKQDETFRDVPIVILSARGEESDIVVGLELGADDYITKPFSPKVAVARVRAVLRRRAEQAVPPEPDEPDLIRTGGLLIHPGRHEVSVAGNPVALTLTEFGILHLLAKRPGWVFTRQQIINGVRGYGYVITSRAVDVQIFGLRKKLGEEGRLIETVRGIGYRLQE
ncbi:MAG: response regulator transcription factor [Desulfobacteraceae bacterium]|nr:response regulator transcription factor [Desulfobacteraceae bacterium]